MKKMMISLLSVTMLATTIFGIQPTVARAETLPPKKQTEYKLLTQKELLPYIDYENAVEHGHVARVYAEEDLNTIVYKNIDGTKTAYVFDYDVKYVADDGTVEDKDIDLVKNDGGYDVKKSDISLNIPNSIMSGVEFEHDGGYIKLTPVRETLFEEALSKASAAQNAPQKAVVNEDANEIYYNRAFGNGTGLRYRPTMTGMKEEIVLDTYTGTSSWKFVAQTNGLQPYLDEGGVYYFAKSRDSQNKYSLGNVYTYDSAGNYTYGTMSVQEVTQGELYTVVLSVDEAFLTDENTVYPVYVDPTLSIKHSSISYTAVYSAKPNNNYIYNTTMSIGYYIDQNSGKDCGLGRVVMRMESLINNATFYEYMDDIVNATLSLKFDSVVTGKEISVHRMSNISWRASDATWNSVANAYYPSAVNSFVPTVGINQIDVTDIVLSWQENENYLKGGLLFKMTTEPNSESFHVLSAVGNALTDKPLLSIRYDTDVSVHFQSEMMVHKGSKKSLFKDYTYEDNVTFTSMSPSIAKVDSKTGTVTGVSEGETKIKILLQFDTNANGVITDSTDERITIYSQIYVQDYSEEPTMSDRKYYGDIGLSWVRDMDKSPLTSNENEYKSYLFECDYISYGTALTILALSKDKSTFDKIVDAWEEGVESTVLTDMIVMALAIETPVLVGITGVTVGIVISLMNDNFSEDDREKLMDCCLSMSQNDFIKIEHRNLRGAPKRTYTVYRPNLNTFENPMSGTYGCWHLDKFAVKESAI